MNWAEQSVLITGGTGSLGQALVAELVKRKCKRIVVFSRDELKQSEMRKLWPESPESPLRYFVGDVRAIERCVWAFDGVDIVIHAAALKQIDTAEKNPWETIQTNVIGTWQVCQAAIMRGVAKVMLVSTDKAVDPSTLYGASKLCAERLALRSSVYAGHGKTRFAAVRYGNVMGSRGSAVHVFREQIKASGRPVTITDPEATRFWITLPQAVDFVLSSIVMMQGGEVFIPKLKASSVGELVAAIESQTGYASTKGRITITGLRPGEKLHEVLISENETNQVWDRGDRYEIAPGLRKTEAHTFRYRSDLADRLTGHELVKLIGETA